MSIKKFRALRNGKTWWYSSDDGIYFKDGYLYEFDDIAIDTNIGIAYQYTGLKDKNGVEIYEGDIVNMNRIFSSIKGAVHYVDYGKANVLGWALKIDDKTILYIYNDDELEIIGNIYENPELVNK